VNVAEKTSIAADRVSAINRRFARAAAGLFQRRAVSPSVPVYQDAAAPLCSGIGLAGSVFAVIAASGSE